MPEYTTYTEVTEVIVAKPGYRPASLRETGEQYQETIDGKLHVLRACAYHQSVAAGGYKVRECGILVRYPGTDPEAEPEAFILEEPDEHEIKGVPIDYEGLHALRRGAWVPLQGTPRIRGGQVLGYDLAIALPGVVRTCYLDATAPEYATFLTKYLPWLNQPPVSRILHGSAIIASTQPMRLLNDLPAAENFTGQNIEYTVPVDTIFRIRSTLLTSGDVLMANIITMYIEAGGQRRFAMSISGGTPTRSHIPEEVRTLPAGTELKLYLSRTGGAHNVLCRVDGEEFPD